MGTSDINIKEYFQHCVNPAPRITQLPVSVQTGQSAALLFFYIKNGFDNISVKYIVIQMYNLNWDMC